jgi:peptidyl-prolyl cis-trans isomerase SurA
MSASANSKAAPARRDGGCVRMLAGVVAFALLALLPAASTVMAQTEQSIAVLVNDDPISGYDIEQRERFLAVTTQEQPSPALKKKATDMLIEERLQMQVGRKDGIVPDEAEVATVVAGMAEKNNMTPDQLAKALGEMGVNIKTLQDRIRSQIVWQRIVQRKFRNDVVIGDAEVDKALSSLGGGGEAGEKTALQLRQLKYELPGNSDQSAIARQLAVFEALRAKVQSCANVPTLTRNMKGVVVTSISDQPGSLTQPARTLVLKAKVGEMTPPTISGSAIEAYAVCSRHASKGDPEKREQAQRNLLEQEYGIRAEGLLRDMRNDAFIEYR